MLRISNLKLNVTHTEAELYAKVQSLLQISKNDITHIYIRKHSMDARKKPMLLYVYTLDVDLKNSFQ